MSAIEATQQRSLIVRAIWYLLIGWWATGIWLGVAWFLNVTIIGLPIGIKMINWVPWVVSLKPREKVQALDEERIETVGLDQPSLIIRAVWFVFIGWWASGIWTGVAYVFTISIIGLPVAIWMYGKLPWIVSLYRY